jgi:hypothetical protein
MRRTGAGPCQAGEFTIPDGVEEGTLPADWRLDMFGSEQDDVAVDSSSVRSSSA